MAKHEYEVAGMPPEKSEQEKYLNRRGKEGWEVITVDNGKVYLRRLLRPNMPSETKELQNGQERQGTV